MVPLSWYLLLAAALFCISLYGILSNRNLIVVLMCMEMMLNSVNINLVAFSRYLEPDFVDGRVFALFVYAVAAAEAALGLALAIAVWRNRDTVLLEKLDSLQG